MKTKMKIESNNTEFTVENSIISYEHEGSGDLIEISLDSREGQLEFAALNVDYNIEIFREAVGDDALEIAIKDCKENHWA